MVGMRMLLCAGMFVAGMICCSAVSAGPIDNANEFVEEAVQNAESNTNPPADQSEDNALISWAGQDSGTDSAVNTDAAGSGDAQ